jgi:hypothetical protein
VARTTSRKRLVIDVAKERAEAGVEVKLPNGKVYIGLEPTIDQMREIADLLPELEAAGSDEELVSSDVMKANLDSLYPQLQALLREQLYEGVDPHGGPGQEPKPTGELGGPPPQDELEKHLTVAQAARILNALTNADPN